MMCELKTITFVIHNEEFLWRIEKSAEICIVDHRVDDIASYETSVTLCTNVTSMRIEHDDVYMQFQLPCSIKVTYPIPDKPNGAVAYNIGACDSVYTIHICPLDDEFKTNSRWWTRYACHQDSLYVPDVIARPSHQNLIMARYAARTQFILRMINTRIFQ